MIHVLPTKCVSFFLQRLRETPVAVINISRKTPEMRPRKRLALLNLNCLLPLPDFKQVLIGLTTSQYFKSVNLIVLHLFMRTNYDASAITK